MFKKQILKSWCLYFLFKPPGGLLGGLDDHLVKISHTLGIPQGLGHVHHELAHPSQELLRVGDVLLVPLPIAVLAHY